MKIPIIIIFMLFTFTDLTIAGETSYSCTVIHVYVIDEKGSLATSGLEKYLKDNQFMVDRKNGSIIGDVLPTSLANSTRVINRGSSSNSFKSIADFGNQFQIIVIKEFKDGSLKPFVSISTGGAEIVTGICR